LILKKEHMMKMKFLTASIATITTVLTAGALAQGDQSSKVSPENQVTITGCIERAAPSATGTSGSTSENAVNGTAFLLTNTTRGAMSSSGSTANAPGNTTRSSTAPPTSGTSTTPGSTTSARTSTAGSYRLDADDSKLTPHVGHKVEISGTLDAQGASDHQSLAAPSGTTVSASAGMPKLKVDSVRMIASSCAQ
jgi:hypothetical protein